MRIEWADVVLFVKQNRGWLLFNGSLLVTSAVKVMPMPGKWESLYTFLYDWLHQFLNLPNLRLTPGPIITPPESKATSSKSDPSPSTDPPPSPSSSSQTESSNPETESSNEQGRPDSVHAG